ncbi:hypothetical protein BRM1_10980 [Brevibacterium sp. BRM-1]|uniref:VC0807 family protein n=1 Tax=Brevibacterium sp. BRM-1 TaxID=2999062 RepID=UPI0022819A36|nr:VC0807 family protein [Brevibacterium sp. BRM-1]WAL39768.1 hypothetical protein BRM1_10980 [Brevibacterium sp. BRM-1]
MAEPIAEDAAAGGAHTPAAAQTPPAFTQGRADQPGHTGQPDHTGQPGQTGQHGQETAPAPRRRGIGLMILLTVLEVVGSIVIVAVITGRGGSDFSAYMWSLLPPAVGGLIYFALTRRVGGASQAILAFNGLSAAVALVGSHDPKVLLYKDCFVTGLIGLIFAASLLFRRPLTFWFGQRFAAGTTPEGIAWWEGLWRYRAFRVVQRQSCVVWAIIMFLEAGAKAVSIGANGFAAGYAWTQILPLVASAVGVALTLLLVARSKRAARAEGALEGR